MNTKRTMSEILIDADNNSTDFNYLHGLIMEISRRAGDFTEEQFSFMKEHFNEYIVKIPNHESLVMSAMINGMTTLINESKK